MFQLRLLGGAALSSGHGPVRGRAAHRRRLALLALLASARSGRVSRDRILGVLWPETEADAGRHLLSEALYVLRKELGSEVFIIAGDEIGIDLRVLQCDLADFNEALSRKDDRAAAALYHGPFLDGFYVNDAPEFERWAEEERARLATSHAKALERLAEASECAGDQPGAIDWWRRLYDDDPHSARVAIRLMGALDATGDRAAAIRLADAHAQLLHDDLGAAPDPAIVAAASRLRSTPTPPRPTPSPPQPVAPPSAEAPDSSPVASAMADLQSGVVVSRDSTPTDRPRWSPRRRRAVATATLLGVLAAAGAGLRAARSAAIPRGTLNVVVLPTWGDEGRGRDGELAAVQHALASSLGAVPRIWTMDGARAFGADAHWQDLPLDRLLDEARARRAAYLVRPEAVTRDPASIAVTTYDVRTGEQVARATGTNAGETIPTAVQRMAFEIARAIAARERLPLGEAGYLLTGTNSPAALSRFLAARDLFRASKIDEASEAFRRTIDADSSFLVAYARLSFVETWNPRWDFGAARHIVDAGLAASASSAPIFIRLLRAQRSFVMRDGERAVAEFQRLTVDDPSLLDAWLGLGESLFHYQGMLGGSPEDARPAFERVVGIDSALGPIYDHLAEIAILRGDAKGAQRAAGRVTNAKEADSYRLALQLRFGNANDHAATFTVLDTAQRNTISNLVRIFAHDPALVDSLGEVLTRASRTPSDRQWGADYRMLARAANGQWRAALTAWRAPGGTPPFDKWMVAAYLAGWPADDVTRPMLDWARERVRAAGIPDMTAPVTDSREALRALVHDAFREGDSARVRELLRLVAAAAARADSADPEPDGLRGTLRARLALLAADTTGAIGFLEGALRRAPWWVSAWAPLASGAPQRMELARLHAARGNREQALRWLNSFGNVGAIGDMLYRYEVARMRAALALGRVDDGRR